MSLEINIESKHSRTFNPDSKIKVGVSKVKASVLIGGVTVASFVSEPYKRNVPDTMKALESFVEGLRLGLAKSGIQSHVTRRTT